jgi:8-oxo-dGTP diphosphatase
MPHIHTDPGQHDHTVTAYIVRTDTPEPRVLLHMHRKLNILLPVGGHIELHETPWQAMTHELLEESGYHIDDVEILQPSERITSLSQVSLHPYPLVMNTHDIPGDHFHSDTAYGFVVTGDPSRTAEEGESLDLRWLSLKEIQDLKRPDIFDNTKEVAAFLITTALPNWDQMPAGHFTR